MSTCFNGKEKQVNTSPDDSLIMTDAHTSPSAITNIWKGRTEKINIFFSLFDNTKKCESINVRPMPSTALIH